MMSHPGKKLLFMGSEFGQFIEWNEAQGLDWLLLLYDKHRRLRDFLQELNQLYTAHRAFWSMDNTWDGFTWINADDMDRNVYSYYREDPDHPGEKLLVLLNCSGLDYKDFNVGAPEAACYKPLIDSDNTKYGGRGLRRKRKYKMLDGDCNNYPQHICIQLAHNVRHT